MKLTTSQPTRVGMAAAKARLSEIVADAERAPIVIQNRGRDVAVIVSARAYEHLTRFRTSESAELLAQIEELKRRFGGGVSDFEPKPLRLSLRRPFVVRAR